MIFSRTFLSACAYVLSALTAYLLGSISFAIIFSQLFAKKDVRDYGSGNAGTTNVLRSVGLAPGICTFFCDFAKGALAIILSKAYVGWLVPQNEQSAALSIAASVAGLFAVLGHLYPLYFGFRGGKGIMTLAGIIFMLSPLRFAVLLGVFIIVFAITHTVSIGSCVLGIIYPFVTFAQCWFLQHKPDPEQYPVSYVAAQVAMAAVFGAIVLLKHSSNIKRILAGTEPKLEFKKK